MKIKIFIVTYKNKILLDRCLKSLIEAKQCEIKPEIYVINNHSDFDSEYKSHFTLIDNQARPDFSSGHLARNWNQAILHGIRDLNNPDCDILILAQNDTEFAVDYIQKVINFTKQYHYITQGTGDEIQILTPTAIKTLGLFDERFCNIGFQEADYFTRANLYLKTHSSINDTPHNRILNPLNETIVRPGNLTGYFRKDPFHQISLKFHPISEKLYVTKWRNKDFKKATECFSKQFILYPYFENSFVKNWKNFYEI